MFISGGTAFFGTVSGNAFSGLTTRKLKLDTFGCAVYILVCNVFLTVIMIVLMFLGCPERIIAGVTIPYVDSVMDRAMR